MGTQYHITLKVDNIDAQALSKAFEQRLKQLNQNLSTYIPDSDLMRLNQNHDGGCIAVKEDTFNVVKAALTIHQQSHGAFDPGLGPLIELWGFDAKQTDDQIPAQSDIEAVLSSLTFGQTTLDSSNRCIKKGAPELFINLSAIAKGYAVDELAKMIEQQGINDYMVEIGGEVKVLGLSPRGTPWNIAIESPLNTHGVVQKVINPDIMGVATSGDYRNYFEKDGRRYSHTIDPTTGFPITHSLTSVTVIAPSAMAADGWSTAMMVLGEEKAMMLAKEHKLAAFFITKTNEGFNESYSPEFTQYLKSK